MATLDGSVFKCGARDDVWQNFLPEPVLPLAASQELPDGMLGRIRHRGPSRSLGSLEILINIPSPLGLCSACNVRRSHPRQALNSCDTAEKLRNPATSCHPDGCCHGAISHSAAAYRAWIACHCCSLPPNSHSFRGHSFNHGKSVMMAT